MGALITNNYDDTKEIRRRIAIAKNATISLNMIRKDKSISKNTKIRQLRSIVFPMATYRSECWAMKKGDRARIQSLELWAYRRFLRISWTEKRSNKSVLDKIEISFITYLNDFEDCLVLSKAGMYADDTHVTVTSDSMEELFGSAREEMMNISEWMRINKLSINPQKTEYMIIGPPRRTNKISSHEPLMLNGAEIKLVKETRPLGILVDEELNWNEQYSKVKEKVSGGLWSLKKLVKIVPQTQLVNHAVVESYLRYANVVWGPLPTQN